MNKVNKVLGFSREKYSKKMLDSMTPKQLDELAMGDDECPIYEDIKDFQEIELNTSLIDTVTYNYWYFV